MNRSTWLLVMIGLTLVNGLMLAWHWQGREQTSPTERPDAETANLERDSSEVRPDSYAPIVRDRMLPSTDDWPAITERQSLRVLITPSRTNFFIADGKQRGFELDLFRHFETEQNKGRKRQVPFRIVFVPVTHDRLLQALNEGLGDVAASMLTVTPERQKQVAFTAPYLTGVDEVLVRHRSTPALQSWSHFGDKTIVVAAGTSYVETLQQGNERLIAGGHQPMQVLTLDRGVVTEDILHMVSEGLFRYTLVDRHLADLWAGSLPNLVVESKLAFAKDRTIAWAVRQNNPQLREVLSEFATRHRKGSLVGNILYQEYLEKDRWLTKPAMHDTKRFQEMRSLFEQAGETYGFDWLQLAMQGYQESRLDPRAASKKGAVGIMQLRAATAKEMGCHDRLDPRSNIMAGARYMAWLRDEIFTDPGLSAEDRLHFCLAAYNAGYRRVRRWRADAPHFGYDPDVWFGQVEKVALRQTGSEPVLYVANVIKYQIAMAQYLHLQASRRAQIKRLEGP